MVVSKTEAIEQLEAKLNELDLNWPNKPLQTVFDELTRTTEGGWIFYYAIADDWRVRGRDPEPEDQAPWFVDRDTGAMRVIEKDECQ